MAYEHLRAGGTAAPHDPSGIAIDRDPAAAVLCGLAAIGLMVTRARALVAVSIVLGTLYMLSERQVDDMLGLDALTYVPVVIATLVISWPQLVGNRNP